MTEFAQIPQPREGEPLDERCPWCGAGGDDVLEQDEKGDVFSIRQFDCVAQVTSTWSQWPSTESACSLLRDVPVNGDGMCSRTPADVEAVCRDIAAETEPLREVWSGGFAGINLETREGVHPVFYSETDEERFRRVLLDSRLDEPTTQAGREIASLLIAKGARSHAEARQ